MHGELTSPYPHHSWLAQWIAVHPPQVFGVHERRHVAHHLLLTTSGDADVRWRTDGAETAYHSATGSLGFFPCDDRVLSVSITSANGFMVYDVTIPEWHLRSVCDAEAVPPMRAFRAVPVFRDPLLEASLMRLAMHSAGRQVSEDIGDEVAARQVLLRLSVAAGAGPRTGRSKRVSSRRTSCGSSLPASTRTSVSGCRWRRWPTPSDLHPDTLPGSSSIPPA
jgi:hypothetical protein